MPRLYTRVAYMRETADILPPSSANAEFDSRLSPEISPRVAPQLMLMLPSLEIRPPDPARCDLKVRGTLGVLGYTLEKVSR